MLHSPWMVNHLFKFRMIPSHIFLLPFPTIPLPQILRLISICQLYPLKMKIWPLPKIFCSFGTIFFITGTFSPWNICFSIFIHEYLPILEGLKNVKYINLRHVNMQRLTDIPQRVPLLLVNLILVMISNPHTLILAELRPGSQTTYHTRPCKQSLSIGPPTNARPADQWCRSGRRNFSSN